MKCKDYRTDSFFDRLNVKDRYEIMAFAAEARCKALGAVPNVGGGVTLNRNIQDYWTDPMPDPRYRPFGSHIWHSAQFRFTITQQWKYWAGVFGRDGFGIQTGNSQ